MRTVVAAPAPADRDPKGAVAALITYSQVIESIRLLEMRRRTLAPTDPALERVLAEIEADATSQITAILESACSSQAVS